MSDLIPNLASLSTMSREFPNDRRRDAALALARRFPDPESLTFFLCQLGLAERHADGRVRAVTDVDGQAWFHPSARQRSPAAVGQAEEALPDRTSGGTPDALSRSSD